MKTKPVIFDSKILEEFRQEQKLQPYKIKQILFEIFKNQHIYFDDMTTLSKSLREKLSDNFDVISLVCDTVVEDTETTKFGFKTVEWYLVETVLMYHWHTWDDGVKKLNRITICVSSQVWCPVWCVFCVTGKLWMIRNLRRDEIISQILYANSYIREKFGKKEDGTRNKVRNVVFMGMWEPLLNYEHMKSTFPFLLEQDKLSLSRRHITISTCGIVSGIQRLIDDKIPVKLAISLHAPNQDLRAKLIPAWANNRLDDLMEVIESYVNATGNRIFYEYIMIKWVTDTSELALELADLLDGQLAHVNLIPYNQNPAIDLEESDEKTIRNFKYLLEWQWVTVTIRDSLWRDAKWACGQLGYEKLEAEKHK